MEFKVNDWVEVVKTTALNGAKITQVQLIKLLEESKIKTGFFKIDELSSYYEEPASNWRKWKPREGDYVIPKRLTQEDAFSVFKLIRADYTNDEYFVNTRYSGVLKFSLSEIEPFTGTLPSRIKS